MIRSLSHGENRGSSPLGSANDFNNLYRNRRFGLGSSPSILQQAPVLEQSGCPPEALNFYGHASRGEACPSGHLQIEGRLTANPASAATRHFTYRREVAGSEASGCWTPAKISHFEAFVAVLGGLNDQRGAVGGGLLDTAQGA